MDGATFKLYDGETEVTSYTGGSFTIKTDDSKLAEHLPAPGEESELTLKETEAPAGYEKDENDYTVKITATSREELRNGTYVTITSYDITIDGKTSADIKNAKKTDTAREDSKITINKQDQDGKALDGAEFKLYDGETEIATYTGGSFEIKTDDAALADYLPAAGAEKELTLEETTAPGGYEKGDTSYVVKLTASAEETLKDGVFVTTTTYGITINGKTSADVTNTKKTGNDRVDSQITINKQDQDGEALDGATFMLYCGDIEVETYKGGSFTISTADKALPDYLPAAGEETELTLKETEAPAGYEKDDNDYTVKITAESEEKLVDGVYTTITTYDITINGKTSADITNTKKTDTARKDGKIEINKQDQDGKALGGATFKLYNGETEVASYTGGSFTIKTDDSALADYLPEAGKEKELTLKETSAPAGYEKDDTAYTVKLTAASEEAIQDGVFVTTTTYGITIDGKSSADITNDKKTGNDREDSQITINKQDQDGEALNGATFKLYDGEKEISTYTGGSFTIKTDERALADYLPDAGEEKELTLKETAAPAGYEKDDTAYTVKLTAASEETLNDDVYVTTTTYDITIEGKTSADIKNTKKTGTDRKDAEIEINKQDQDGEPLDGAAFKLYDGETEVAAYTGGSFTIRTDDDALAEYLPEAGEEKELTFMETAAPEGYEKDDTAYTVKLSATSEETLDDDVYVTTTTYDITIDGMTSADITNVKTEDEEEEEQEKERQDEDSENESTSYIRTGDEEKLFIPVLSFIMAVQLLILTLMKYSRDRNRK